MATYTKDKDVETVLEDDTEARKAMQEVFNNTSRWPANFGGFTADVVANINGEEQKGTVTVKGPKDIKISIEEENAKGLGAKFKIYTNKRHFGIKESPQIPEVLEEI